MGIVKKFNEFIKESIWSDMQDRGTKDLIKREDDVNSLDCTDFFEYLKTRYEGYCDSNYIGMKDNYIKFYLSSGCRLHIRYNDDGKTIKEITTEPFDKDFFSCFEAELKSKNVKHNLTADFNGSDTFEIKDKNGNTSNRTVIEFIDNYFNYVIDEEGEKILLDICDELRPDYKNGEEITLDKILKLAKYELVVNRYSKKARFFNFIEKNYDDIMNMIKNNTGVYESIWSDMQERGTGDLVKKEDDYVNYDIRRFGDYLDKNYVFTPKYDGHNYTKMYKGSNIVSIIALGIIEYGTYYIHLMMEDTDNGYLLKITKYINKASDLFNLLGETYVIKKMQHSVDYSIEPKEGTVNNKFYIEVLEFLLQNAEYPVEKIIEKAI